MYCYNMDTKESTLYSFDLNKKNSISDNMILNALHPGRMDWVVTVYTLFVNLKTDVFC